LPRSPGPARWTRPAPGSAATGSTAAAIVNFNWALHVIALQRVHHHHETRAYYQRLLANGKTAKGAKRCIKRALARHFYQRLR
jgi:hypothetical protein